MARLPQPGGDNGNWGTVLNDYLSQSLESNGTLKDGIVAESKLSSALQTKLNQVSPTWSTLSGKPAVVAAGASQRDALNAISAAASARADRLITVGPGGDFATLNEAIQEASRSVPDYTFDHQRLQGGHYKCEIRQLTGFVMAEQVFVVGQDLSFITITSQGNAEITITRSALNQNYGGSAQNWRTGMYPAFCAARGARLPFIKTLYSMDNSGTGSGTTGVYIHENSLGVIAKDCGVKNAGWRGLYVDGSIAYARGSIWDGSGFAGGPGGDDIGMGIRGSNMSIVDAREASAKNCNYGAYFSRAYGTLNDGDFSGSAEVGIGSTDGADVSCSGANVNNSAKTAIRVDGGLLYGSESSSTDGQFTSATNSGEFALVVLDGGIVRMVQPSLSSTGTVALQVDTSTVDIRGGTIQTSAASRPAVRLYNGARINLPDCKIEGTSVEIELNEGSTATVDGCLRVDNTSPIRSTVTGGEFSTLGHATADTGIALTAGESTMSRRSVSSTGVASANGALRLTFFTARKTETITAVRTITGSTAQVGATLARIGVYEVAANGNLTLVASTPNDNVNLWIATGTRYTSTLSVPFVKTRGTRYAVGYLLTGTSTAPTFTGQTSLMSAEALEPPMLSASMSGQTDLPSSVTAGSLSATNHQAYIVLVP